jgi:GNAT superfamily N-acetyltransferase
VSDVTIGPEPWRGDDARRLIAALDADLDVRYADDDADPANEPDHAMLNLLDESVAPPLGAFLVARLDGEAVGCGALRPSPTGEAGVAEVKRMYVAPAARRRGISRAILAALEAEARALGYRAIVLETGTRQAEAMALYEAAGYSSIPNYGAYRASALSRCYRKALEPG